jgi:transcriptional regulator with GAF, ATPase, and Fis domain
MKWGYESFGASKVLRALQESMITKWNDKDIKVDVRVVAATKI